MKGMGDYVNDIRAALVMNPNFCRLRFKGNEATEKKNGYIKSDDASATRNICKQDSNGNICQGKDVNDQSKKVSFKSEQKAIPIRRRASDTSVRENRNASSRTVIKRASSKEKIETNSEKSDSSVSSLRRNHVDSVDNLIQSSIDDGNNFTDRSYSHPVSKDASCEITDFCEHSSLGSDSQETSCTGITDVNAFYSNALEKLSLEDIVALYSSALKKDSGQLLKCSDDTSLVVRGKKKRCNMVMFYSLVLIPSLLFYLLVFIYTLQLEPFYSLLLKRLKLRYEEPVPPTILPNFVDMLWRIVSEYSYYSQTLLEDLLLNFNYLINYN